MDKRDVSERFRKRLAILISRSGLNHSAFAARANIDRSALSQLLSGATTRLPRSETLVALAGAHGVSLDWLLGLSQDEGQTGELRAAVEIGQGADDPDHTLLTRWHEEASGTKIRYVPANIPDQLRTEALIAFEAEKRHLNARSRKSETDVRLAWNRRAETDMEVCMPRHTLELLAAGQGIFSGFRQSSRRELLAHMATLVDELYPSFRLHLFDAREHFSAPYTVFGTQRAAIYMGDLYLVLNATDPIRTLTRHFDGLIRGASIQAHEAAAWIRTL
jgi:transcriptional regulator with XRE-family HTH domain